MRKHLLILILTLISIGAYAQQPVPSNATVTPAPTWYKVGTGTATKLFPYTGGYAFPLTVKGYASGFNYMAAFNANGQLLQIPGFRTDSGSFFTLTLPTTFTAGATIQNHLYLNYTLPINVGLGHLSYYTDGSGNTAVSRDTVPYLRKNQIDTIKGNILFTGFPTFNNAARINVPNGTSQNFTVVGASGANLTISPSVASLNGVSVNIGNSSGTQLAHFGDGSTSPESIMPYLQVYKQAAGQYEVINKRFLDSVKATLPGGGTVSVVNSITGTPNQVIVSNPTGNVTLSLPQSIATTNTPTFAGDYLSNNTTIPTTTGSTGTFLFSYNNRISYKNLATGYTRSEYGNFAGNGVYKFPYLATSTLADSSAVFTAISAQRAHTDSSSAAYTGQKAAYTLPTSGSTYTDASLINMYVYQVERSGLIYDIITSGTPTSNQVLFNGATGQLTFSDAFNTTTAETAQVLYKAIANPSPIAPAGFQILYAANYATAATYFTGTSNKLIFVKNDEVNGGTNDDGTYAATIYQYTYNLTTGVPLIYVRGGIRR